MKQTIEELIKFMKAQQEAEERGEQEFTCPICGAVASWGRAKSNNHLHCGCNGCGFSMIE